jgi:hypothetical protein
VVLREGVSRDAVDDAAGEHGWRLTNVVPPSATHPAQMIFAVMDGEVALYLVEDAALGILYAAARGPRAADALREVRASLSCHEISEAAALLDDGDAQRFCRGLAIAVLQQGGDGARVAVERALVDARGEVRAAGLHAAAHVPSPALRAAVAACHASEPDRVVREAAERLLAALAGAAP